MCAAVMGNGGLRGLEGCGCDCGRERVSAPVRAFVRACKAAEIVAVKL